MRLPLFILLIGWLTAVATPKISLAQVKVDEQAKQPTKQEASEAKKPAGKEASEASADNKESKEQAAAKKKQEAKAKKAAAEAKKKEEAQAKAKAKKEAEAEKAAAAARAKTAAAWIERMRWRAIGPTAMGGRIVDLAVVENNPDRFWIATASGGVFKTVNNGVTFEPQFQFQNSICIGDVAVAPSNPEIVWVGTGENNARNSVSWGDGVYKSIDGGATWKRMGLTKSFHIGRIAIHPTNPDIVYVCSVGRLWGDSEERGLYKSTDGGATWEKILNVDKSTGCIELAMQPGTPDTLLCATYERRRDPYDGGDPVKRFGWGSGLFKTTDGGKNWRRVTDGLPTVKLGRVSLDFVKTKPHIVYATVESEKIGTAPEGAKLPALMGIQGNATDGSATLTSVTEGGAAAKAGLKTGDVIIEMAGANVAKYTDIVAQIRKHYAGQTIKVKAKRGDKVVEVSLTFGRRGDATKPFGTRLGGQLPNIQSQQGENGFQTGGVYRSDDAGESWTRVNSLNPRPFYFSQIRVDPNNENVIFVLGIQLHRSTDGGKTFRSDAGSATHADHHAMWINPSDSGHILLGCDGGLNTSYDGSNNWDFNDSLPIGQFYHVGVDTRQPYHVFGGLQDNGSWAGPSALRGSRGPSLHHWFVLGGGDGFICLADPTDPDIIYYESQYGNMARVNLRTGARNRIRPRSTEEKPLQFNWKTPFLLSSHNPKIYYCLANYAFRSLEQGDNLRRISPKLTTTARGTGTAFAESPRNPDVLYAGTDDGALWATVDGGKKWKKLRVPGLKTKFRVSSIEASRFDAARAYATLDSHYYDDDRCHVFVTENSGASWKRISSDLPSGSARVIREDAVNPNVLYLGTEFGIWVTLDRGANWMRLNNNLPHVAVHEIAVHPTAGEIVAGTHGRSLWILDVTALRQFTKDAMDAETNFFRPKTAVRWQGATGTRQYGRRNFVGENPPSGALFTYTLGKKAKNVSLTITDVQGQVINQLGGSKDPGMNVIRWALNRRRTRGQSRIQSPRVEAGVYLATLSVDGTQLKRTVEVRNDPQFSATTNTFEEDERLRKLKKVVDD